jgi:phosphoribosylformylglycinamidine synthase
MIQDGLVESAHDCSEGGIAVALAESSFREDIGFKVELPSQNLPAEFALFGEDASRIVISCDPKHLAGIKEVGLKYKLSVEKIGETVPAQAEIKLDGRVVVSTFVAELRDGYESTLEAILKADPAVVAT